jgi:hypothetical protein
MIHYLLEWGHMYLVHVGALTSAFAIGSIYKEGLPYIEGYELIETMIRALCSAALIAIFSSHAHSHYLSHFTGG